MIASSPFYIGESMNHIQPTPWYACCAQLPTTESDGKTSQELMALFKDLLSSGNYLSVASSNLSDDIQSLKDERISLPSTRSDAQGKDLDVLRLADAYTVNHTVLVAKKVLTGANRDSTVYKYHCQTGMLTSFKRPQCYKETVAELRKQHINWDGHSPEQAAPFTLGGQQADMRVMVIDHQTT